MNPNIDISSELPPKQGASRILILHHHANTLAGQVRSTKHSISEVTTYMDLNEIVQAGFPTVPACLLLGHKLADGSDPMKVLERLRREKWWLPVVFFSPDWNLRSVVETMQGGASDFLRIPVDQMELSNSLSRALDKAVKTHGASMFAINSKGKVDTLSKREADIVRLVIKGLLNKEIADRMGLALITIKVYRAQAMKKLGAGNPAELVKISFFGGLDTGDYHEPA